MRLMLPVELVMVMLLGLPVFVFVLGETYLAPLSRQKPCLWEEGFCWSALLQGLKNSWSILSGWWLMLLSLMAASDWGLVGVWLV